MTPTATTCSSPGSGPSSPAEYEPAQHMYPAEIADIAAWLASALPEPAAR
jgi:hypothetical protein